MRKLDQVNSASLFIDVMIPRKYLEKENIFSGEEEKLRGRRRKIFGEGKYIACGGEEKRSRKRRNIFGEGQYSFLWRKRIMEKEEEDNIWRRKN